MPRTESRTRRRRLMQCAAPLRKPVQAIRQIQNCMARLKPFWWSEHPNWLT